MPDWTYQTLFRPLLFRLAAPQARALTLGALQHLGAHRAGPTLIALMGHTKKASAVAPAFKRGEERRRGGISLVEAESRW